MFITLTFSLNDLINKIYFTLNNLIIAINKYAKNESYAIRKRRFKSFKKRFYKSYNYLRRTRQDKVYKLKSSF